MNQQCALCQNYKKPKQPDLHDNAKNPCYEGPKPYRETVRGAEITCWHFSYITSARIQMAARKARR